MVRPVHHRIEEQQDWDVVYDVRGHSAAGSGFVDVRHPAFKEQIAPEDPMSLSIRDPLVLEEELAANPALSDATDSALFTARDVGWYAEMLYCFKGPTTRAAWSEILFEDLTNAAVSRAILRKSRGMKFSLNDRKPETAPDYEPLKGIRADNWLLDSVEGRAELVAQIAERAGQLSLHEKRQLPDVIRLGKAAMSLLVERHTPLVFMISCKMEGAPWDLKLSAGYEGLVNAVRGYSEQTRFKFSTYAGKMIGGAIKKEAHRERAASLGATPSQLASAYRMRDVENDLTVALRRQPTDEEISAVTRMRPSSISLYRDILRRKPADLRQRSKSEFEYRVPEPGESLKHHPLYEKAVDQTDASKYQQRLLRDAFSAADLTSSERALLQSLTGDTLEIAQLNPSEKKLFRSAQRKMLASQAAAQILRYYVSGPPEYVHYPGW